MHCINTLAQTSSTALHGKTALLCTHQPPSIHCLCHVDSELLDRPGNTTGLIICMHNKAATSASASSSCKAAATPDLNTYPTASLSLAITSLKQIRLPSMKTQVTNTHCYTVKCALACHAVDCTVDAHIQVFLPLSVSHMKLLPRCCQLMRDCQLLVPCLLILNSVLS